MLYHFNKGLFCVYPCHSLYLLIALLTHLTCKCLRESKRNIKTGQSRKTDNITHKTQNEDAQYINCTLMVIGWSFTKIQDGHHHRLKLKIGPHEKKNVLKIF